MNRDPVEIFYMIVAFLFAICVHESAHAWTANKCGDPTARMLGRISLNPIRHIDPIGTILVPAIGLYTGFGFIGWAKPTPVDPRNLRHPVRDDILTSVAGPVSNMIVTFFALLAMQIMVFTIRGPLSDTSIVHPIYSLLAVFVQINILLAAFNLIPIPPLDGSHVMRHLLSESAQRVYDMLGYVFLMLMFFTRIGGVLIGIFEIPFVVFFQLLFPRLMHSLY